MSKMRMMLLAGVLIPFALPTDAAAQGRSKMGGSKSADWDAVADKKPKGITLSGGDLEKLSPLKMFISKKKDLKLTDEQLAAVTEANTKLMETNAENFEKVDTYRKTLSSSSGGAQASADDMARTAIARDDMMKTVGAVRMSYEEASKMTVESLSAEQQETAAKLLEKHAEEMQKTIGEKLGGGGGGRGGRGGRGGPGGR